MGKLNPRNPNKLHFYELKDDDSDITVRSVGITSWQPIPKGHELYPPLEGMSIGEARRVRSPFSGEVLSFTRLP